VEYKGVTKSPNQEDHEKANKGVYNNENSAPENFPDPFYNIGNL
jgi:hypothetical protein